MNELAQLAETTGTLEREAEQLGLQDDPALQQAGWSTAWLSAIDAQIDESGKKFFTDFAAKAGDAELQLASARMQSVIDRLETAVLGCKDGAVAVEAFIDFVPLAALRKDAKPILDAIASLQNVLRREYWALSRLFESFVVRDGEGVDYQLLDTVCVSMYTLMKTSAALVSGDLTLMNDPNAYAERLALIERQITELHASVQPDRYEMAREEVRGVEASPMQFMLGSGKKFSLHEFARLSAARGVSAQRSRSPGRERGSNSILPAAPQANGVPPGTTWMTYFMSLIASIIGTELVRNHEKYLTTVCNLVTTISQTIGIASSFEIVSLRYLLGIGEAYSAAEVSNLVRFFFGWQEVNSYGIVVATHPAIIRTIAHVIWANIARLPRVLLGQAGAVIGVILLIAVAYFRNRVAVDRYVSETMPEIRARMGGTYDAIVGLVPGFSSPTVEQPAPRRRQQQPPPPNVRVPRVVRRSDRIQSITPARERDPDDAN